MAISKHILLSIIIPFYNVEKYITDCLDSVYNQDMPEDEYEVICVNDASPDNSREIVIEYQKKHSNLILIEHEVNKKLGSARNTGRTIARGKYIWNVDSDDYIKPNVFKRIKTLLIDSDLDILMFNHDVFFDGVDEVQYNHRFVDTDSCSGMEFIKKYFNYQIGQIGQIWSQIYRFDYLNNKGIYSPEINMAEDGPFTWRSLLLANKVMSISDTFYIYRMNNNSLTMGMKNNPTAQLLFERVVLFNVELIRIANELKLETDKNYVENIIQIIRYTISTSNGMFSELPIKQKLLFLSMLRDNKTLLRCLMPYFDRRRRLILKCII